MNVPVLIFHSVGVKQLGQTRFSQIPGTGRGMLSRAFDAAIRKIVSQEKVLMKGNRDRFIF